MKRIFYFLIAAMLCMALILPAGAEETGAQNTESRVQNEVIETEGTLESATPETTADEVTETKTETEDETVTETVTETASESNTDTYTGTVGATETESDDIAAIIDDADSRLEVIVGIAGAMGITLEEAEALVDRMIELGDEHLADTELWAGLRADMLEHPQGWLLMAFVILMFIALVTFLIRGLIKQTMTQSSIKTNIVDIKNNEEAIERLGDTLMNNVTAMSARIDALELENADLKGALDVQSEAIIGAVGEALTAVSEVLTAVNGEADKLAKIEQNSATSVKVNEEQALRTVQLLNIAMGRKLPSVSAATRKLWYEDSVAKIKEAAAEGGAEESDGNTEK